MATLHISLPDSLKEFVQEQSVEGDFSNPSDYVRTLIRREKEQKAAADKVEAMLRQGLESGEAMEVTDQYWDDKKARLLEQLKSK